MAKAQQQGYSGMKTFYLDWADESSGLRSFGTKRIRAKSRENAEKRARKIERRCGPGYQINAIREAK